MKETIEQLNDIISMEANIANYNNNLIIIREKLIMSAEHFCIQ